MLDEGLTDGIISLAGIKYPHKIDIPIVELNSGLSSTYNDVINTDVETGMVETVEYLLSLGHQIGFVGEKNTYHKLRCFKSAMTKMGVTTDPSFIFISDKRFELIGQEAAEYFMKLTDMPTALICAYDEVAIGAIKTFAAKGISVPDDISVVGMNDIPAASYTSVPLTTIGTYSNEIIKLGVNMLIDKIRNPGKHMTQHILVRCELIVRSSTARAKNTG